MTRRAKHLRPIYRGVEDAVRYYKSLIVFREKERNEFFLKLLPFITFCIENELRCRTAVLEPVDREDLDGGIHLYILEKWMVRLKKARARGAIIAYLIATVRGCVLSFLKERFGSENAVLEFVPKERNHTDPGFIRRMDFLLDRDTIQEEMRRRVDSHMQLRRGSGARDVVERMVRVLLWQSYRENGELGGPTRGNPSSSALDPVPVG